ncbi:MAG: efflux RND transporter periplasmic adaptor subunit [Planctomycetota bacterium]
MKQRLMTFGITVATLVLTGALIAGAAIVTDPSRHPEPPKPERVLAVDTLRVQWAASYEVERSFLGRVEARRRADAAFDRAGLVIRVLADDGDVVPRGQPIAELDTARLDAERAELDALLEQSEAQAELTRLTLERVRRSHAQRGANDQELDDAEQGHIAAMASASRARAAIARIDVELAKSILVAPFDGIVAERLADEGDVVSSGQRVFRLLERERPEARIGVGGEAIDSIVPSERYTLIVRGRSIRATAISVLPERRPGSRSVQVRFELDASLDGLREGDIAELILTSEIETRGVWLPMSALSESARGLWAVYVVESIDDDRRGKLARREVELLHTGDDRVYVRGPLEPGESVVEVGRHRIVPGLRVSVEADRNERGGS